jgi:3-hydroxyisobutyrate dehydrogenase-like beta-hydroxyacid dehydrogenase
MSNKKVGLIGLGAMGQGIGKNLLKKGFLLQVYDITPQAIEVLVQEGATSAESISKIAETNDILITVLPDGPDVEKVVLGTEGALISARTGTIIIDCSTIDPAISKRIGDVVVKAGCKFIDAGLGGTSKAAQDGTLSLFVGAQKEDLEEARPVLEAFSAAVFHCGEVGAGVATKVVNNILAATILCANIEALLLGVKAGLDVHTLINVLTSAPGGGADNMLLKTAIPMAVLPRKFDPGFKAALAHKDVGIGQNMAARLGVPLFTLAPARQLLSAVVSQGNGERHVAILAELLESLSGERLS